MKLNSQSSDNGKRKEFEHMPEIKLEFEDNNLARLLYGDLNKNLTTIEETVGVSVKARGNELILKGLRHEVELAENGKIACNKALASMEDGHPYDLILMDIQMPVLDGYEATRLLRQGGWQKPILALTAHAMAGDRNKCLEVGCDDYVEKLSGHNALINKIQNYLTTSPDPSTTLLH